MNTSLQSQWLVKWLIDNTYLAGTILLFFRMAPYLFIWIAMTFLYLFIPNTRVSFRSAVFGGVLAGTAWQLAQWGYFYFQVGMTNYNAIYGTLAALPSFLVWVYISWSIVLLGLEVVYAHQHRASCTRHPGTTDYSETTREMLALSALLLVCECFHRGMKPPSSQQLGDKLGIPVDDTEEILETLRMRHLVIRSCDNGFGWIPGREPSSLVLDEVLTSLRGNLPPAEEFPAACRSALELLDRELTVRREVLRGRTVLDMVAGVPREQASDGAPRSTDDPL